MVVMRNKKFNSNILLLAFSLLGIIFRLWLVSLVPQPFGYDQSEYTSFAWIMMHQGLNAWQTRLYGYPLILALIYTFSGFGNWVAVRIFQSLLDVAAGLLIFLLAKKIFKKETVAWTAYLLYLFNPYTSAYVGVFLSEVTAVFLVALIFYLTSVYLERKHTLSLILLVPVLGFLPQVRPVFIFYTTAMTGILILLMKKRRRIKQIFIAFILLILYLTPFAYNIVGNLQVFKQFSLTTVDNLFVREFYISLYVSGRSPFHAKTPDVFPKEVQQIYNEFSPVPKNKEERQAVAKKYLNLGISKIKGDPWEFIVSRIKKFWYVWEKHFLFYYVEPESKIRDFLVYWGNVVLLGLAFTGSVSWVSLVIRNHNAYGRWFAAFTISFFAYISLANSISLAEERYSLPAYPLVFLFAAGGISFIRTVLFQKGQSFFKKSGFLK